MPPVVYTRVCLKKHSRNLHAQLCGRFWRFQGEREDHMSDKIVVCLEKGGSKDMAEAFSRRIGAPMSEKPGEQLTVLFNLKGVSLTGYGLSYQGDFENMLHRVTNGRLQHEMLVRASKSEKPGRKAIDATAGMGEDGFLLAAQGYEVIIFVTAYDQYAVKTFKIRASGYLLKPYTRTDIASEPENVFPENGDCLDLAA